MEINVTLRRAVLALIVLSGLAVMHYFAPLQAGSMIFDLALIAVVAGAISLAVPLRILDIRNRRTGALVLAAGTITGAAALSWPASWTEPSGSKSALDEYLPKYQFGEFHDALVHAPPEQACRATRQTTSRDLNVSELLMALRRAAQLDFRRAEPDSAPMLEAMTRPGSPFVLLSDSPREIVLGLAGAPWDSRHVRAVSTRDEYLAFNRPGNVKVVFNIKVDDAGGGWSRITTETRVAATDASAGRKMAAYWRVIYPGSATIRRMWLRAIKARAERM